MCGVSCAIYMPRLERLAKVDPVVKTNFRNQ
jgi:hypothetical protein